MSSGENQQALRKIPDLARAISLGLLILHLYYYCFDAFPFPQSPPLLQRILGNIAHVGMADRFTRSRLLIVAFLFISLIGARGRKNERSTLRGCIRLLLAGTISYLLAPLSWWLSLPAAAASGTYILLTVAGWLLIHTGGTRLSGILWKRLDIDIFNRDQETFPQEERLLSNDYSLNFRAIYASRGDFHYSWVNIVNPFRGVLVLGNPGCGKSRYIIRPTILQHIQKGFSLVVYDFKYDELSLLTYNLWRRYGDSYPVPPKFYMIQFDDLSRTHRCNPLDKAGLRDISDAAECARTILLGLNRDWIQKQGSFWVESPINFLTALIWFLHNYGNGRYCTLPHVIELAQTDYNKLFTILRADPYISAIVNPFIKAYLRAPEQLEGQVASATIGLARLSSPKLYWVLTGDGLTLDINNPQAPKILCLGNNPAKSQVYGAILSLYMSSVSRMLNRQGQAPCGLVLDEFPTLYFNGIDKFMATARSNQVATTLAVQDASQLRVYYGRDQADTVLNIAGNLIAGQLRGDAAKQVSDSIGRIQQERESISVNSEDTSFTRSKHLDAAVPVSRIASLSAGEFVGVVADNPDEPISLKAFNSILMEPDLETDPADDWEPLPIVERVTDECVQENYKRIKAETADIVQAEISRIMDDMDLSLLMIAESPIKR
ncbi:MAG: YWFCY domain-containing protein [Puia sp.]|nr:YWFCY domain-containing protein [Puia sp.]